jgi:hypothetical protein
MTPGGFGAPSSQSNTSINPQSTSGFGNVGSIQQPSNQGASTGPATPSSKRFTAAFTEFSPISHGSNPSNLPAVTPSSLESSSRLLQFDRNDLSELTLASRSDLNTTGYAGFNEPNPDTTSLFTPSSTQPSQYQDFDPATASSEKNPPVPSGNWSQISNTHQRQPALHPNAENVRAFGQPNFQSPCFAT